VTSVRRQGAERPPPAFEKCPCCGKEHATVTIACNRCAYRVGMDLARAKAWLKATTRTLPVRGNTAVEVARIVADHWRRAALEWGDDLMHGRMTAHPLCCVLAALDGETDPRQLGVAEGSDADAIRALGGDDG
jgi:hypothetical protein